MVEELPIVQEIKQQMGLSPRGVITFRDYMELCLYHPEFGYYTNSNAKIGREGDFYTSSFVGSLMGEIIAAYIINHPSIDTQKPWKIIEWGGGDGRLAKQIMAELTQRFSAHLSKLQYTIIEQSSFHRQLQRTNLEQYSHQVQICATLNEIDSVKLDNVVVLSNELIDAFPVHLLQMTNEGWQECYVTWNNRHRHFEEIRYPLDDQHVLRYISQYVQKDEVELQPGQRVEINLAAEEWIREVASKMDRGLVMTIDYGDIGAQLYASWRFRGTLLCYRKHQAHDDPYVFPGEQDITSHVNFDALMHAGEQVGLKTNAYMTQKQFLVENGILDKLVQAQSQDPFSPEAKRNRAIRQLLWSDQMSESFKVLIQEKG